MSIRGHIVITYTSALLAAVLISGCKKPLPNDVLARVGDREIRIEEFRETLRARQEGSPVPADPKAVLDLLIDHEILVQSARKAGLEKDREIQEQIRDVLVAKLKERKLTPQFEAAAISDVEVNAAYESSRTQFTTPERVHLAALFLQAPADGDDAAAVRQRLETAQSRVKELSLSGTDNFGGLAVEFSEDQETRYRGGDLGWIERDRPPARIDPAVIDAGFALPEPGACSGVIRGERGFYLVKLIERQAPSVAPLASVEPAIRARLLREKREKIEAEFLAALRQAVPVKVHPERLPAKAASASPAADLPPRLP